MYEKTDNLMSSFRTRPDAVHECAFDRIPEAHPVRRFNDFWRANLNAAGLFDRRSFVPMKAPDVLPWMLILDAPEVPGAAFTYRLCGTGFTSMIGAEFTGTKVGELINPEAGRQLNWALNTVVATGEPLFSSAKVPVTGREFINVFRGMFPASMSGDIYDQAIAIVAQEACMAAAIP